MPFINKIQMTISELKTCIRDVVSLEYSVVITRDIFQGIQVSQEYNRIVRHSVLNRPGIYFLENASNNEILYIGMAGKINQLGQFVNHSVQKRLQASRGKNLETKKDISTARYLKEYMGINEIEQINIHVIHLREGHLPGYIEAFLINEFFQRNRVLPKLNSAF